MNRKKGRPPGKVYPEPDNVLKGIWNAKHGKIGISESMHIAMFCPYRAMVPRKLAPREKEALKDIPRAPWSKKHLKQLGRHLKKWDCAIGPVIGRKIATGDHQFFHELGDSVEELAKESHYANSPNKLFALEYKLGCLMFDKPFTLKGLRSYYRQRERGHQIDDSTLSKLHKWARSAKLPHRLPEIPEELTGKKRARN
jgi:hypothetical protein